MIRNLCPVCSTQKTSEKHCLQYGNTMVPVLQENPLTCPAPREQRPRTAPNASNPETSVKQRRITGRYLFRGIEVVLIAAVVSFLFSGCKRGIPHPAVPPVTHPQNAQPTPSPVATDMPEPSPAVTSATEPTTEIKAAVTQQLTALLYLLDEYAYPEFRTNQHTIEELLSTTKSTNWGTDRAIDQFVYQWVDSLLNSSYDVSNSKDEIFAACEAIFGQGCMLEIDGYDGYSYVSSLQIPQDNLLGLLADLFGQGMRNIVDEAVFEDGCYIWSAGDPAMFATLESADPSMPWMNGSETLFKAQIEYEGYEEEPTYWNTAIAFTFQEDAASKYGFIVTGFECKEEP